jgi:hypothetical protein
MKTLRAVSILALLSAGMLGCTVHGQSRNAEGQLAQYSEYGICALEVESCVSPVLADTGFWLGSYVNPIHERWRADLLLKRKKIVLCLLIGSSCARQ